MNLFHKRGRTFPPGKAWAENGKKKNNLKAGTLISIAMNNLHEENCRHKILQMLSFVKIVRAAVGVIRTIVSQSSRFDE